MTEPPATPACPFCGEPHPILSRTAEEIESAYQEADYPEPECEHFFGRYDTDDGYHYTPYWITPSDEPPGPYLGWLGILDELDLPSLVDEGQELPQEEALEAAFGDRLKIVRAVYSDGSENPGHPMALFDALVDEFGIKTIEIWGGSGPMSSWISYDYYAPDPKALAERLDRDAEAVEEGVRALKG